VAVCIGEGARDLVSGDRVDNMDPLASRCCRAGFRPLLVSCSAWGLRLKDARGVGGDLVEDGCAGSVLDRLLSNEREEGVLEVEFVERGARAGIEGTGMGEIAEPMILIVWLLEGAAITEENFANAVSLTYRSSISA